MHGRNPTASIAYRLICVWATLTFPSAGGIGLAAAPSAIQVNPPHVILHGTYARAQLVVTAADAEGRTAIDSHDLTRRAMYGTSNPRVVSIDEHGELLARGNGEAQVAIIVDGISQVVPVTVSDWTPTPDISFHQHVSPILSRAGCNQGACHASQYGKGGFVLSVFAFDPQMDHASMIRDRHQRRVNLLDPEESLLLKKPTMQTSHGGGQRLVKGSVDYQTLITWIKNGAPGPVDNTPHVTHVEIYPQQRRAEVGESQQIRVQATYSDGSARDVTGWARFNSLNEGVVSVNETGVVEVVGRGQATVMVRFEGEAQVATFMIPYENTPRFAGWENRNFVDELAIDKFRQLGIEPSPLCDDETFIRRAFLDAVGTIPTPEQTREFVSSNAPHKRAQLVNRLLGLTGDSSLDTFNDQYAAYWTLKWSDLLRNTSNGDATDEQRMWSLHNWIKESFRTNKPFDQFVREMVTAKGSTFSNGPASYYELNRSSDDLAENTAQLFLGVRLQCAKCHHHPFEKYSQDDYYSFAAFFSRVGTKTSQEFGLFGREQVVMVKNSGEVRNPRSGKTMSPKPLGAEPLDHPLDRRIPLAEWLTSKGNKDFARSVANRYVAYLLGRGLVEPVDDMRSTNPASNPELLDRLAQHFVDSDFNIKQLMQVIMTSRLYQLDSQPLPENASDDRFYSHYLVKRLAAEPLLDAVDGVTLAPTKFRNLPAGTRAIELPDGEYPDYFLTVFGKPKRASVCECERSPDENLAQALHTLNGDVLAGKISAKEGRVAKLAASEKTDAEAIQELYLAALCRMPTSSEIATMLEYREQIADRKEFLEDLLWGLMNSKQFLFVR